MPVLDEVLDEISRRYTDVDLSFYEPQMFRTQHESNRQASKDELINPEIEWDKTTANQAVHNHHKKSLELFDTLIEAGVSQSRSFGVLQLFLLRIVYPLQSYKDTVHLLSYCTAYIERERFSHRTK